jgi:sec-independent protein translocase protein TatB
MGTPPPIQLASLGMADSLILMVLALVVFGPRRLPQIGRQIGKLMYEFRKASNDFKFQMEEELRNSEEADRRKKEEERQRQLALTPPAETISSIDTEIPSTESEAAAPRIQPPSTGEQVAAGRPTSVTGQSQPVAADETGSEPSPEEINPEADVEANAGIDTDPTKDSHEARSVDANLADNQATPQAVHHG